jgi:uncharacterized protein
VRELDQYDAPSLVGGRAQRRFHVMVKPVGSACNLDCAYCFYLGKESLPNGPGAGRMSDEVLEELTRQYISGVTGPEVVFSWQGGEPSLLGLDFFRKAVALQKKYARPGQRIENDLQTNGTLLDEEWSIFLKENRFLVGLSIDGPRELHDHYRVTKNRQPTFDKVFNAAHLLRRHGVPFNTLTCVSRCNARRPLDVYRFLRRELDSTYIQFIPIVEHKGFERTAPPLWTRDANGSPPWSAIRNGNSITNPLTPSLFPSGGEGVDRASAGKTPESILALSSPSLPPKDGDPEARPGHPNSIVTDWSVDPEDWGYFLCKTFDEWRNRDWGRVLVNHFETLVAQHLGQPSQLCVYSEFCGKGVVVEHDGSVYACDHYVYPEYRLGTLKDGPLASLVFSRSQVKFGYAKNEALPPACRQCAYLTDCWGECPKNRILRTQAGEPGLNYLCRGFKTFFEHARPEIERITAGLRDQPFEVRRRL